MPIVAAAAVLHMLHFPSGLRARVRFSGIIIRTPAISGAHRWRRIGSQVAHATEVTDAVLAMKPGDTAHLTVMRGRGAAAQQLSIDVTLGTSPGASAPAGPRSADSVPGVAPKAEQSRPTGGECDQPQHAGVFSPPAGGRAEVKCGRHEFFVDGRNRLRLQHLSRCRDRTGLQARQYQPLKWIDNSTSRIFSTPSNVPPAWGGALTPLAHVAQ
jgi:hypothetical protein